jgi:hypothetical protein
MAQAYNPNKYITTQKSDSILTLAKKYFSSKKLPLTHKDKDSSFHEIIKNVIEKIEKIETSFNDSSHVKAYWDVEAQQLMIEKSY